MHVGHSRGKILRPERFPAFIERPKKLFEFALAAMEFLRHKNPLIVQTKRQIKKGPLYRILVTMAKGRSCRAFPCPSTSSSWHRAYSRQLLREATFLWLLGLLAKSYSLCA